MGGSRGGDWCGGGSRYPDEDPKSWKQLGVEHLMDCYQFGKVDADYWLPRQVRDPLDKWDKRFIKLAKEVSTWSKDGTKVGAVLTRPDHTLVSVGFNGLVPGMDDSLLEDREFKNLCIRHAEPNALWLGRHEPSMNGYTMYIHGWPGPCGNCAAAIVMAGLGRVVGVYENDAKTDWSRSIEAASVVLKSGKCRLESYKWSDIDFTEKVEA